MQGDEWKKTIKLHQSEGMIEEANYKVKINDEFLCLNRFNLRLKKIGDIKGDISSYNSQILKEVKTIPQLYKEIREYNLLFRFFKKLKIKSGYVKKSETPDFILKRYNKTYGIEVTRIYTGNDWVAEKLQQDIAAYRLSDKRLSNYINAKKYTGRIKTYQNKNKIVVKAVKEKEFRNEELIQIKNKIFEKIRKQIDDYNKYDYNFIFAEIVFTDYDELTKIEKLNQEIHFFISHLDVIWGNAEFHLILKMGNVWNDFNLKTGEYQAL